MSRQPLVSVCINCYNAEKTIADTIRSVLEQTYTHLQVIVVDDCSTDGTWELLQSFSDERLELHRLERNGHISNANNEALRYVRGEYVAHLDADDVWFADKTERQVAFLETHPAYGACFTLAEMVDENGTPVEDHRFRAENRTQAELLYHFLTVGNYLCHSSMLARREIIDRVGEHDVTLLYLHDFDYWIRMAMLCELYIFPEKLLYYRIATSSNSAMTAEKYKVHIYEFSRIIYQSVVRCPDALFLAAFADRLRLPDAAHTHEQVELEKAFILLELLIYHPQNRALGLRRLSELLIDSTYVDIARDAFGFTVKDLYKLEETTVYHDEAAHTNTQAHIASLQTENSALNAHAAALATEIEHIRTHLANVEADREDIRAHAQTVATENAVLRSARDTLEAHANALTEENAALDARATAAETAYADTAAQLALVVNSRSWKLTVPLRALKRLIARLLGRTQDSSVL